MAKLKRFKTLKKFKLPESVEIEPIPWIFRRPVPLIVGADYYLAFGPKWIYKGELISTLRTDDGRLFVRIAVDWNVYCVYSDEIGRTLEEAVLHTVSN